MSKFLSEFLKMPFSALILCVASACALSFAFILQYGFDVQPCVLCLWQRLPFGLVVALSVGAYLMHRNGKQTQILLRVCGVTFLVGAGLAFFHTGVELHWWLGTSGCSITPLNGNSFEDLRTQLLHTVVAHCDQINWTLLGFSMANWNVPFSLGLGIFSLLAAKKS